MSNTHSNQVQQDQPGVTPESEVLEQAHGEPGEEVLGGTEGTSTVRDPDQWATGDEPMTGAQASYLDTLAREAGEEVSARLTKAEASAEIDRLQQSAGRGA